MHRFESGNQTVFLGRRAVSILLASILLSSGCLSSENEVDSEPEPIVDSNPDIEHVNQTDSGESVSIPGSPNCDDTNTDHCMLPFPSGSFLDANTGTETGYSLSIT